MEEMEKSSIKESKNLDYKGLSAVEAISFAMKSKGWTKEDMIPFFGNLETVEAVLSGEQEPSVQAVRRLHTVLGIPLEVLVLRPQYKNEIQRILDRNFDQNFDPRKSFPDISEFFTRDKTEPKEIF